MKKLFFAFALLLTLSACLPRVTQGEEIGMVQPKGWWWMTETEKQQAANNLTNSQANQNNGQARVADAQAKILANQNNDRINAIADGGFMMGAACFGLPLAGLLVALFVGFIVVALTTRKREAAADLWSNK